MLWQENATVVLISAILEPDTYIYDHQQFQASHTLQIWKYFDDDNLLLSIQFCDKQDDYHILTSSVKSNILFSYVEIIVCLNVRLLLLFPGYQYSESFSVSGICVVNDVSMNNNEGIMIRFAICFAWNILRSWKPFVNIICEQKVGGALVCLLMSSMIKRLENNEFIV